MLISQPNLHLAPIGQLSWWIAGALVLQGGYKCDKPALTPLELAHRVVKRISAYHAATATCFVTKNIFTGFGVLLREIQICTQR